jgi:hypothetical protein
MIILNKNIVVKKGFEEVYNLIYNSDDCIHQTIYDIREWKLSEWKVYKGKKIRNEEIYLYVDSISDALKSYTVENDKFVRISRKHKIKNDGTKYKEIKTKYKIKNFKTIYKQIIKCLDLISIKDVLKIIDLGDGNIEVDILTKINITMTNKEEHESYAKEIFEGITTNIFAKLQK